MKYKRSPLGLTKAEHCANYTMRAAKLSMSIKVTPDLCDSMAAHTQISLTNVVEVVDQEQQEIGAIQQLVTKKPRIVIISDHDWEIIIDIIILDHGVTMIM
ncbi:hypothetical protein L915_02348 [Phytophthora nicotianae]|uniref:Uncharacterized protein n=1 Tax=Phytophthora nicotianae TaxID=4792 RepID=W2HHA2_PHYNI|nr:hypothetical protein L915_02348 [Phytophthora nicotianae]